MVAHATDLASRAHVTDLATDLAQVTAAADPDDALRGSLGANLLHWWEPREDQTTLNGSNISQIDNLISGGGALVQATAGNQPLWVNDGSGQNGRPFARLQDLVRRMTASITALGTGHRTGVYIVGTQSTDTADRYLFTLHTDSAACHHYFSRNQASGGSKTYVNFSTETDHFGSVDDYVADPCLRSSRPLSTGFREEINGALTATGPTNTDTLVNADRATLGHQSSDVNGGDFYCCILTVEPTASIDDAVKEYVAARFALTLS